MGGNGKHRWKISFFHRHKQPPDKEFFCPISGSLMSDPVVVISGQTFERVCLQVCRDLGYVPLLDDQTTPDFSTFAPNLALKNTILNWCKNSGAGYPESPDYTSVERIVRTKMRESPPPVSSSNPHIRVSERELLKEVSANPPVLFSHAATEIPHRLNHFHSSSSEGPLLVNAVATKGPFIPLPLTTRPACFSSASASAEFSDSEFLTPNGTVSSSSSSPEEDGIVAKLRSPEVHEQEEAVISLRMSTKAKEEFRSSLCTQPLLSALRPLIVSNYEAIQVNAVASLVNLSLEKSNKVKIVRSGFVPPLIEVLESVTGESQEHAAGALFSLSLEDENKAAIGVLGGIQPLMRALSSESEPTRHDSALALYHLTLAPANRVKLVKLGAVPTLLSMVRSESGVLLILCNLTASNEGRSAMLEADAVGILVGMLREGVVVEEASRENCVAALYGLSRGSLMRFEGMAKEARAVEVLREVEEKGSQRAREKAKKILMMMTMTMREVGEDTDWNGMSDSGGFIRPSRFRVGRNTDNGPNSSNF